MKRSIIKLETEGLKINYLVFADELALWTDNCEKAEQQVMELNNQLN